jgi:hypothetical protein
MTREELIAEPWTDDDQRDLNSAIADAMLHWDEMPMDPDDVNILIDVLKICLKDYGFCIARTEGDRT